ncbi:MAG TPA: hypothetical protein VFZ47_05410, partial [Chitinophagaceae bacterium]
SFYFKGTLNGADISWLVPSHKNESSFTYHAGASLGHTDFSSECLNGYCYYVNVSTEIKTNVANINPHIAVSINMAVPAYTREIALSWFVPGPKTYPTSVRTHDKPDLLDPAKNGVVVYYVDQNGTSWSSNRGSQQGSSFESISFNNEPRTDVAHEKVWKAKFSCTLYSNAGNSIKVENAEIYGPILLPKGGNSK